MLRDVRVKVMDVNGNKKAFGFRGIPRNSNNNSQYHTTTTKNTIEVVMLLIQCDRNSMGFGARESVDSHNLPARLYIYIYTI